MRLYFDRNFRFGGYSTSAQEYGNEVINTGFWFLSIVLLAILGPITGIIGFILINYYNKSVEEDNAKIKDKRKHFKKAPPVAYFLSILYLIIGFFMWIIILSDLTN